MADDGGTHRPPVDVHGPARPGPAESSPRRPHVHARPTRPRGGRRPGVVVIDRAPLYADGVAGLVDRDPGLRWLGAAHNGAAAVELVTWMGPDVALLDADLDADGALSRELLAAAPRLALLRLYPADAPADQPARGHGLLRRSASPVELMTALHHLHTEGVYRDPVLTAPAPNQPLTSRERQVLGLIAEGLENQAVAKQLYLSVETVRTQVKSVLRKLDARDRAHAVALAARAGLVDVAAQHRSDIPGV